MDEEFELEMSPLCHELNDGGKTVQVDIHRGSGSDWCLEVVDQFWKRELTRLLVNHREV